MKKFFGIALAFALCIAMTVCAFAITVNFDNGQMGYASIGGHTANGKVENGVLTFDMTDSDPQIYITRPYDPVNSPYGVVNADKCKQIEIRFATEITSGTLEIFFTSKNPEDGSWFCKPWVSGDTSEQSYVANSRKYKFETSGSLDDFVTLTIDRADVPYWKGIVTSLRIDPDSGKGKKFALDYVKFPGEDPEPEPEPEAPAVTPEKPQWVLDEEKLYGECLIFDDFESYDLDSMPTKIYYSKAGTTGMGQADQCKEYKVVSNIGSNATKSLELISTGSWKFPMLNVVYKLEEKGEFTMLMDAYTEVDTAKSWCFHNGYSSTSESGDIRYRDEANLITTKKWQTPKAVHGTNEKAGLTSVNWFRYGAFNLLEGEKIYIDNIRAYFKPYMYATVNAGGAQGTVPEIAFVENGTITFPVCTLTKDGYTFDGWKTNLSGKVYKAGEKLSVGSAENITVTATWSKFRPVTIGKNSIRTDGGMQGIRFAGYVTNENKKDADEYGFIVTRKSLLGDNQLVFGTNSSDTSGVSPDGVKYVYGAAYDKEKGIDEVYATDGKAFDSAYWENIDGVFFTGVLTEIGEPAY